VNKMSRSSQLYVNPIFVDLVTFDSAFREAATVERDFRLPALLPLLLDSRGMLDGHDWHHGFYSAWLVIESDIMFGVEEAVRDARLTRASIGEMKKRHADRFGRLPNNPADVESVAESLAALVGLGLVTEEQFLLYDKLRKRRNEVLHPNSLASQDDATVCFGAATEMVFRRARQVLGRELAPPPLSPAPD
ncbi:MAG TPA: hypothetical protein VGR71_06900, partial [Nitrospira sp.]|nr:hypothetical protein [Nitrospira sp.]